MASLPAAASRRSRAVLQRAPQPAPVRVFVWVAVAMFATDDPPLAFRQSLLLFLPVSGSVASHPRSSQHCLPVLLLGADDSAVVTNNRGRREGRGWGRLVHWDVQRTA